MATDPRQGGPRFADLSAQPAGAGTPPSGGAGVMSNNASMEAILTSPVQQARVQAEMSKERLKRLAHQLAEARHALV